MIKTRPDVSSSPKHRSHRTKPRRRAVREYRDRGYQKWAEQKRYGKRWPGTDGIFSEVKRKYGENVMARSTEGPLAEGYQRIWAYEELREYGERKERVRGGPRPQEG